MSERLTKRDRARMNLSPQLASAFRQGEEAFKTGKGARSNGYCPVKAAAFFNAWMHGYRLAKQEHRDGRSS